MKNFTRDIDKFIYLWCRHEGCFEILSRYFPLEAKLPMNKDLFINLLEDILSSYWKLASEIPTVTTVYGSVAAVSITTNLLLLFFMFNIPYKSSTAVFLTALMFLDIHAAGTLLVQLYYLYNQKMELLSPGDKWKRKLSQGFHIFWPVSAIFLLLLVVIDRWFVSNTSFGRLFMYYRKVKIFCSLVVLGFIITFATKLLPSTVDIMVNDEKVEVYVCVTNWCCGSSLLNHSWRVSDDRIIYFLRFLQLSIILLCLIFLPLYGCTWSTVSTKISMERMYETERTKLKARGQEVTYFNSFGRQKQKQQRSLPVIYEVDESEEKIYDGKEVLFPYSIQIFHNLLPTCSLTRADTYYYDTKPIPENAVPVSSEQIMLRRFDNVVDPPQSLRGIKKGKGTPTHRYKTQSMIQNRLANYNRNALLSTSSLINKLTVTGPISHVSPQSSSEECKTNHVHGDSFNTRQIALSINCCCNRAPPIECHTEITYMNDFSNAPNSSAVPALRKCLRSIENAGDSRKCIPYNETYVPVSTKVEEQSLIHEARATCATTTSSWIRPMWHNVSTELHVKINMGESDCDSRRDCKSEIKPSTAIPSTNSSTENRAKDYVVNEAVYSQLVSGIQNVTKATCRNNSFHKQIRSSLFPEHCTTCAKRNLKYEFVNVNWNNQFTFNDTPSENSIPVTPRTQEEWAGTPTVDFMSSKTLMILYLVREHFVQHFNPLVPFGIPDTLQKKDYHFKLTKSKNIIIRLLFLTVCYVIISFIPCLIELTIIEYSTLLYMSNFFSGTLQFISLVIFSSDFRHKLARCILCRRY